jgi:hypothetical protein
MLREFCYREVMSQINIEDINFIKSIARVIGESVGFFSPRWRFPINSAKVRRRNSLIQIKE